MVRKRSWPAVSHYALVSFGPSMPYRAAEKLTIWSLTVLPSSSIVRILKSTWTLYQLSIHRDKQPKYATSSDGQLTQTHSDGRDVALGVGVVGKSEQKTRLSDTRVTNQQKLC